MWGEIRTLVRARLEVINDMAAVGATERAAAGATETAAADAQVTAPHWASPAVIKEAMDFTFIPAVGAFVTSTMHGRCRVVEVEMRFDDPHLLRYVMATDIVEIQCRKMWHVVRAYHRCALLSIPSESIAETVGERCCYQSDRAPQTGGCLRAGRAHPFRRPSRSWWRGGCFERCVEFAFQWQVAREITF